LLKYKYITSIVKIMQVKKKVFYTFQYKRKSF
jgi:hypothetical protein